MKWGKGRGCDVSGVGREHTKDSHLVYCVHDQGYLSIKELQTLSLLFLNLKLQHKHTFFVLPS